VVDQSKEDISDCKGLRDVANSTKFWPNKPKKSQKWPYLQLYATHQCRVWFWDRVCAIGEFIYDTPLHKGQRGVIMATNFGTKIAINAYKCFSARDNENVITYNNEFLWSTNPKNSDCKGPRDVAMATNLWPK